MSAYKGELRTGALKAFLKHRPVEQSDDGCKGIISDDVGQQEPIATLATLTTPVHQQTHRPLPGLFLIWKQASGGFPF